MQSIDSIETYAYGTSKGLAREKKKIKYKYKNTKIQNNTKIDYVWWCYKINHKRT